jgi:F0F1-type ATP synthase membrane subunit b/b'
MQGIGHQLGELFLQAVPTVLIILFFYFILRALFFKPLLQVMAEREARTVGAQKAAVAAQAAAAE